MAGGLLVAGTTSDAGKSVVTAGICRWLRRRGVRVAPFKAQNMSNNAAVVVTSDGRNGETGRNGRTGRFGEIGRAQALQAVACGLDGDVRFNPILLKPESDQRSQVVMLGRVVGRLDATDFDRMRAEMRETVLDTLASLRRDYDVVVCEGAGSPAEINLRRHDLVNMGLARAAGLPVVLVGDIDRGGVFAALYGTVALLDAEDQALLSAFIINKFRGLPSLVAPAVDALTRFTGRPTLGMLPWNPDIWLDAEDSMAYGRVLGRPGPPRGSEWLRVAVVHLPHLSNATDAEALASEPGVQVRFTVEPGELADSDLVVLPGTKSTVADLSWLRSTGLAGAITAWAQTGRPLVGICGGFQMLATRIRDDVESGRGEVAGLGLLPVAVEFAPDKTVARTSGTAWGEPVRGYEIHHGRVSEVAPGTTPLITLPDGSGEGAISGEGNVFGTHWHGAFESDGFRRAFLAKAAALAGRRGFRAAPDTTFAALRERYVDLLGDLVEEHLDTDALWRLIERGAPAGLPMLPPGAPPGTVQP
jgi:adenosylcobyric acid synthase